MENVWEHHFKFYDLFQNNSRRYRDTLSINLKELKPYKKILDTGAGSGNLTLELLKEGHEVFAVDIKESPLKILKEKCKEYDKKLKVMNMDVHQLEFKDEEFDAVSSMFVIPLIKNNKKYLSEVHRILKKGGKLVISGWSPVKDSWKGVMEMLEEELKQKKLLPKYKKEWKYITESSKINVQTVLRGAKSEGIKKILERIGFRKVMFLESPYKKYAYIITASK